MLFLPDDKMFTNKFVDVQLPSKAQIFSRTGQRALTPAGAYTGDESVKFGSSNIDMAESVAQAAESFEVPDSNDSE